MHERSNDPHAWMQRRSLRESYNKTCPADLKGEELLHSSEGSSGGAQSSESVCGAWRGCGRLVTSALATSGSSRPGGGAVLGTDGAGAGAGTSAIKTSASAPAASTHQC